MNIETAKIEWQAKMQRYYDGNSTAKEMAIDRVRALAFLETCWDWDDNVSEEWAKELADRWGIES